MANVNELIDILMMTEDELFRSVSYEMYLEGREVHIGKEYIFVPGKHPVLLVAHMDTVHSKPPYPVFHDSKQQVLWSPDGLGADDRAGVFAILNLLRENRRVGALFTLGEESGGTGVCEFTKDFPHNPGHYKMLIQLDRRNHDDAVFYDCDSKDFQEFVTNYGFFKKPGLFSDISILGPDWKINSVNLSVGFMDEHMSCEHLYINSLFSTMGKVREILELGKSIPYFPYEERISYYRGGSRYGKGTSYWDKTGGWNKTRHTEGDYWSRRPKGDYTWDEKDPVGEYWKNQGKDTVCDEFEDHGYVCGHNHRLSTSTKADCDMCGVRHDMKNLSYEGSWRLCTACQEEFFECIYCGELRFSDEEATASPIIRTEKICIECNETLLEQEFRNSRTEEK